VRQRAPPALACAAPAGRACTQPASEWAAGASPAFTAARNATSASTDGKRRVRCVRMLAEPPADTAAGMHVQAWAVLGAGTSALLLLAVHENRILPPRATLYRPTLRRTASVATLTLRARTAIAAPAGCVRYFIIRCTPGSGLRAAARRIRRGWPWFVPMRAPWDDSSQPRLLIRRFLVLVLAVTLYSSVSVREARETGM
jgi:hypothetical protein